MEKMNENISKAKDFATIKHEGQTRKDDTPYINHPLRVADNVSRCTNNEALVEAALLHDTLEDTNTTYDEIVMIFGKEVGNLVLELTSDDDMKHKLGKSKYLSLKMEKMSDEALTIKLYDRLDNICDAKNSHNPKFIEKYIKETMEILSFLIDNRELLDVHKRIINDIILELGALDKDHNVYLEQILDLMAKLNTKNKRVKVLEKK